MDVSELNKLKQSANSIRRKIIATLFNSQTGHAGSSLSMVEILTILYFKTLNISPTVPRCPNRDFLILSKGHGSPALYCSLCEAGLIDENELLTLRKLGSRLQGHPNSHFFDRIDVSTGSLGQGLSIASGLALGLKLQNKNNKVFCILGDGELQEGQNWEAALAANHFCLGNLVAIVDRNKLQNDGDTENVMPLESLPKKWEAFGWNTLSIDGHDLVQLDEALNINSRDLNKPTIIVANTIKGKGVSFMEGIVKWHHHPISEAEYLEAMKELSEND